MEIQKSLFVMQSVYNALGTDKDLFNVLAKLVALLKHASV